MEKNLILIVAGLFFLTIQPGTIEGFCINERGFSREHVMTIA